MPRPTRTTASADDSNTAQNDRQSRLKIHTKKHSALLFSPPPRLSLCLHTPLRTPLRPHKYSTAPIHTEQHACYTTSTSFRPPQSPASSSLSLSPPEHTLHMSPTSTSCLPASHTYVCGVWACGTRKGEPSWCSFRCGSWWLGSCARTGRCVDDAGDVHTAHHTRLSTYQVSIHTEQTRKDALSFDYSAYPRLSKILPQHLLRLPHKHVDVFSSDAHACRTRYVGSGEHRHRYV